MKAYDTSFICKHVAAWKTSSFNHRDLSPWRAVAMANDLVRDAQRELGDGYEIADGFAVHRTARIEAGVVLKGPGIIGPECFVAAGAYLRDAVYLQASCTVGPGCEIKSSFVFAGSKLAHFNFVGDSIIGSNVNIEAGAIIANHRNELADKLIRIIHDGIVIETGVEKFGSLVGDGTRIGANAVIAPGAILLPSTIVGRLELVDQSPRS